MSDQFVAEIRIFPYNFAPLGWATCNGQLLPINQNTALFSLLGTNYGGNGLITFGLPNLAGSFPMATGDGPGLTPRVHGDAGGTPSVSLLTSELPIHTHGLNANPAGTPAPAANGTAIGSSPALPFRSGPTTTALNFSAVTVAGGSQPHNNMPPFLALQLCIALQGIFPARG